MIESRLSLLELRKQIARLPSDQRALLSLICIDGLSYKEAAQALDSPAGTVMSRLARARRALNDAVAWLCGALLVLPPNYFRIFHFAHHRFTQNRARDPELAVPAPATPAAYWWRVSGLPYWRERLQTTLRHALTGRVTEPFVPPARAAEVVREARTLWACYLGIAAVSLYLQRAVAQNRKFSGDQSPPKPLMIRDVLYCATMGGAHCAGRSSPAARAEPDRCRSRTSWRAALPD